MSIWQEWSQHDPGFCESKLLGEENPEYLSGFSALFVIFFALLGLHQIPLPISIWQIIYSFEAVAGVGSIGYHLSKNHGWGLIDGYAMMITFHLASYHCYNILCYNYFVIKHVTNEAIMNIEINIQEHTQSNKKGTAQIEKTRRYSKFHAFSSVGSLIHIAICCLFITLHSYQSMTMYASSIMGLSLLIQFFLAIKWIYVYEMDKNEQFKKMKWILIRSIIFSVLMALLSSICETLCANRQYEMLKYFPHHTLWHIVMSWALYGIIISLVFMDAYNYGCKPYFRCGKWYYQIIPIIGIETNTMIAKIY